MEDNVNMARKIVDEQFKVKGNNAVFWLLSAQRLKRSGNLVFDAYADDLEKLIKGVSHDELQNLHNLEIIGCAMLLYGLSLENVAKGLIVKAEPPAVVNGKLRKWSGSGHNQRELLKEAGVTLSPQEEDLVTRLTDFVEWAGRYPIPKIVEKMCVSQRNIDPSTPWVPLPFSTNEREVYDKLFARLESMF